MLKSKRNKIARMKKGTIKQQIMDYFLEHSRAAYNYRQVAAALGITRQTGKDMVNELLHDLLEQHFLQSEREGRYQLAQIMRKDRKVMGDDIMSEFELPESYPEEAEKAAMAFSEEIHPEEYSYREDFRQVPTFTIDPQEAKDFDDALSIRALPNGNWEIGVHIADVTFYVKPDSVIDREAEKRATSVYLVDRTIPMLPERLCNQVCSLRPDEEKRCFSCIFELDSQAEVKASRIRRTVIKSDCRLSYDQAQDIIDGKSDLMKDEMLQLNALAKLLRERRFKNGSIRFESQEICFRTDENGKPLSVYFKESGQSHNLIEEFMLLANRTVAEYVGKQPNPKPFVYRVHDLPDMEKLADVSRFIKSFGHHLDIEGGQKQLSRNINKMLDEIKGTAEENMISSITIRAMAKAVYSTDNIGHYGLAFSHYTHFTSPIRRYPDMMVHRLLERYLNGGKAFDRERLERRCEHCSAMEQLAAQAERASIKSKQVEFMADQLGRVFKGHVSGVSEFGMFVEIDENKCEGLVAMRDLEDDHYDFDEKNYRLIGRHHKKVYRLGDTVYVLVARANMDRRQLDFVLTDNEEDIKEADSRPSTGQTTEEKV